MKKLIAILLAMCFVFTLAACGSEEDKKGTEATTPEKTEGVMTYEEYMAAEMDSDVCVEVYVQATQSWWDNKISVYAQDKDGAYFIYEMACSEEDAAKLYTGTKIRVTGYKGEWAGEVEIMDATFEFVENGDSFYAPYVDYTELLGTDELIKHQNERFSFKGLTVEPSIDPEGNEVAFLYGWDGSGAGKADSDLYFTASYNGQNYTFVVEYYLCNETSPVYQAVQGLRIGQTIDLEGYLYWYEGVQPHVTSVTVTALEDPMSYEEYMAAEIDDEVTIEAYVQATQAYSEDSITLYLQNEEGAFFAYQLACTEEDAYELGIGTKVRVTGYKAEWAGEVEIMNGSFSIIEDAEPWVAEPFDATELLGTDELIKHQNEKVSFKNVTIVSAGTTSTEEDEEGNAISEDLAFLYGWDGSGSEGTDSDLYFKGSVNGQVYTFVIEYALCDESSSAYQAVQALKVGDVVDLTGFMYWYEGPQAHIISVTPAE